MSIPGFLRQSVGDRFELIPQTNGIIATQSACFALTVFIVRSEEVLLPTCAGVRVEVPLNITVLVLKRTAAYLEGPEAHTRPYLAELTGIIRCPDKHMMPDLYDIVHVLEGNNSATLRFAFSRWQRGEEVLENLYNSLANWCGESLEESMSATVFVQENDSISEMPR